MTYGIGLQAWCVYLMAAHVIPVHRCAELTGARPSPGFVHGVLARAAAAVRHANQLIRALIITASVICADETPIRVGPGPKTRKRYLLVACTNLLTYYFLGDQSLATFEAFVFPGLTGVMVHDRYQNYDKFPGIIHQLCAAHRRQGGTAARPAAAGMPARPRGQQKISGLLRSEQATRHQYAIRGYISTAAKHDISVFTALRDALTGNPWMPPTPATS